MSFPTRRHTEEEEDEEEEEEELSRKHFPNMSKAMRPACRTLRLALRTKLPANVGKTEKRK